MKEHTEVYFAFVGSFKAPTKKEIAKSTGENKYENAVKALLEKSLEPIRIGENPRGTITLDAYVIPEKPYAVLVNTCTDMWEERGIVYWPLQIISRTDGYGDSLVSLSGVCEADMRWLLPETGSNPGR